MRIGIRKPWRPTYIPKKIGKGIYWRYMVSGALDKGTDRGDILEQDRVIDDGTERVLSTGEIRSTYNLV